MYAHRQMEILLTRSSLARVLNVDPRTIQRWIERGKIKQVAKDLKGRPLFKKPNEKKNKR